MTHSTFRLKLNVADGSDPVNTYPGGVESQAMGVLDAAVLVSEGTISARPAANTVESDHIYRATDTKQWYISDGANWNTMIVGDTGWLSVTLGAKLTAGAHAPTARLTNGMILMSGTALTNATVNQGDTLFTLPGAIVPAFSAQVPIDTSAASQPILGLLVTGSQTVTLGSLDLSVGATVPSNESLVFDGVQFRAV